MINPLRGEVAVTIDGREVVLRPTFDAISKWEHATGKDTFTLARAAEQRAIPLKDVVAIIQASATPAVTADEIKAEITSRGLLNVFLAVVGVTVNAFGIGRDGGEPGEA